MKKSQYYPFLFLMLILSSCYNLFSQNSDSIMLNNSKYKYEVGIDMQGLIRKEFGSTFILKIKRNEKSVNLKGSKNYRFQLSLSGNFPISEKTTQFDSLKGYINDKSGSSFGFSPMMGLERIKFYGKFNFYFGIDFGPYYSYYDSGYGYYVSYYNNTNPSYGYNSRGTESKNYGVSVNPFVGIKYRISSRFSASMESGFGLTYFLTKEKYNVIYPIQTNVNAVNFMVLKLSEKTSHGFAFSMQYLRFLTINYHL